MKFSLLLVGLLSCTQVVPTPLPTPTPTPTSRCQYQAGGVLPDPVCTPGATNMRVTQDTIQQTICTPGYSTTIRSERSPTYFSDTKRKQMGDYGVGASRPQDYEEDHLISLELGGSNDQENLWPEPGASPNAKDEVENKLHREVCSGQRTLDEAQTILRTDWRQGR